MEKFIEILLIQFTISRIWRDDLLIFRKLLYISKRALGIFESRLIKIKKERNLGWRLSSMHTLNTCRYIIRQEFALPQQSSSSFPNIGNLYSIVETSEGWHLHPQGVPSIIAALTPYFYACFCHFVMANVNQRSIKISSVNFRKIDRLLDCIFRSQNFFQRKGKNKLFDRNNNGIALVERLSKSGN